MGHAQRDDLVRMRFERVVAIIGNAAGFGRHQTDDGVQGGGLAGAVGSDQETISPSFTLRLMPLTASIAP